MLRETRAKIARGGPAVTSIAASMLPFFTSLPAGYGVRTATGSPAGSDPAASSDSARQDVLDVRVPLPAGNFTAEAGDALGLRDLFDAGANAWDSIARYRVALRDDPASPGGGRLLLRGSDVTSQVDFSPAEFNELQFIAGPDGARSDLVVVARQGTPNGKGGLAGIVDSPALQITASTTGTRSINAAAALRTVPEPGDGDARFLRVAQDAALFSGLGKTRPSLTTVIPADDPVLSPELLAGRPGSFQALGWLATDLRDPALLYGGIGAFRSSGGPDAAASSRGALALALLLGGGVGGVSLAADAQDRTLLALQAYQRATR